MPSAAPGFTTPYPAFPVFEKSYNARIPQLVMRRIIGDLQTPVGAYLKLAGSKKNCFLLESIEGGERLGRYSIIGLEPDLIWRADKNRAFINRPSGTGDTFKKDTFQEEPRPALESLRELLKTSHIDMSATDRALLPPMAGGLFGYFGYDTIRLVEKLGPRPAEAVKMPDAIFMRPGILVVFDNVRQEIFFISPIRPQAIRSQGIQHQEMLPHEATDDAPASGIPDAATAYRGVTRALDEAIGRLSCEVTPAIPHSHSIQAAATASATLPPVSNTSKSDYASMVETAKDHIRAGDIFQVVLSQRFSMDFPAEPFELYRALRRLNPSPFLFFLNFSAGALVGSSPEILVRIRDSQVTIRPIAGTRRRGETDDEDKALEAELLSDPKERAEHLMLLDLGRNDVGRTARIGSVQVTDEFAIERYSHVMHIVSNVTGELREDIDPLEALLAGFPAGTVSGAPKIRAMEIIDELEHEARGPYGGCIGYFSTDGSIDSCIALRTALVKDGKMHVQAGAGIVADSVPALEQAECENKAGALIAAAQSCLP